MKNEKNVVLRLIVSSDIPRRVEWMNDARVYPSMGFTPPISLENSLEWYNKVKANGSRVDLAITDESGDLLAFGGLTDINNKTRKAEFYVFVNPDSQGQGFGSKATYAICQYGFNVLGLHKIFLLTNESNVRARNLYERIGFKLEGIHRDEKIQNDNFEARYYYGLLREEFNGSLVPLKIGFELYDSPESHADGVDQIGGGKTLCTNSIHVGKEDCVMNVRRLSFEDLSIRVKWLNDERIYHSMKIIPPITLEATQEWFYRNSCNPNRVDLAVESPKGEILAFAGIVNIDKEIGKAETYIFVDPDLKGKGIGTEVKRKVIEYGFGQLDLFKLYFVTKESNLASQKMNEKLGYRLEGRLRGEKIINGSREDRFYYGLLKHDLQKPFSSSQSVTLDKVIVGNKELTIVRDDIFPKIGGGNKARKAIFYEQAMREGGFNASVTTGGIQSNHNRAIALMCARNCWHCHLVYHGTEERFNAEKGNALLVRKSGATVEFVEADQIGPAMDAAMERFKAKGLNPLYIHGGGHDIPGGAALVEAVKALKDECAKQGYKPDYIFHASGTGSTQAGIAVGLDLVGWSDVKLIGISVARQKERGTQVIEEFANELASYYNLKKEYQGLINFNTDYLCGGYEQYTSAMAEYLDKVMRETGLMFDTTYSGKAFYGMMDYLNKNKISARALFWHTGGLMNLMK
ncbi:MAG: GNAT family N-acetyltransferase [Muribaculum sp.]|nr:GNAT family N-acetyltransferase [Muribaculum sp.]